jgi:energy-coupling factor transporter ATP-binding protein EcfA2
VLVAVDCVNGAREQTGSFPHVLRDTGAGAQRAAVQVRSEQGALVLSPIAAGSSGATMVCINSDPLREAVLLPERQVFSLQLGRRLLLLCATTDAAALAAWPPEFEPGLWQVFNTATGEILGEVALADIPALVVGRSWPLELCAACPKGLGTGFHLAQLLSALVAPPSAEGAVAMAGKGRYFCPACWLRFDAGDVLSIAAHDSLSSDPVLGDGHMFRFSPTHFNDLGQAIDPMGLPAPEMACPHCRRRLPHSYLDLPHRILSLIGAPGSGKSYFLAALTQILHDEVFRDFGLVFKDGDPSGNILLNQMRTRFFSGATPEECMLDKTQLRGATYETLRLFGRDVVLPRPFVYTLSDESVTPPRNSAVIFYDNAGEHFEPGRDAGETQGAMHIVSSSGILFLYDPTSNPRFRRELANEPDPQLRQSHRVDRQDSILAEMEVRMKKMLGLPPAERIPVPVAILVGKCDVWRTLLDAREFPPPVRDGRIDSAGIDASSARVRALLAEFCPGLVAHAESLSHDVRYFAVSSLGHSPIALQGADAGLLAPDPRRIAPIGVKAPVYWLLGKILPELVA